MAKNKRTMDAARLCQELLDTLSQWDGEDLAEIAAQILGHKVKYLGEYYQPSMFEIIEEVK